MDNFDMKWLEWARDLQSIAQNGLTFANDPYDIDRYSSVRRIAAEILAAYADLPAEHVLGVLSSDDGYMTPKVDVRAAVFQNDRILLVRERSDGLWTLPGGWVDPGEAPSEAIEREVREESGYEVRAVKLLALFDRDKHDHPPLVHSVYKLFFQCDLIGGAPSESIETNGADFYSEKSLPGLSLSRVTTAEIFRLFEHYRQPHLPTDFD